MGGLSFVLVAAAAVVVVVGVPMLRPTARPPRVPEALVSAVLDALPGGNCGACGNDSCFAAACAVAAGRAPDAVCATGGSATAARVMQAKRDHGRG